MDKNRNNSSYQSVKSQKTSQTTLFNLAELESKKVEVNFTLNETSNDGGLLLLREVEKQIGLIKRLSGCIEDTRHQSYVKHPLETMLRQRIMQIAAGYEDANDCNRLKDDEILKICCESSQSLSSQPTMSRFENYAQTRQLYLIAQAFVDQFIASYQSEPKMIILDSDDTNSLTYGNQQLSIFNNY